MASHGMKLRRLTTPRSRQRFVCLDLPSSVLHLSHTVGIDNGGGMTSSEPTAAPQDDVGSFSRVVVFGEK